MANWNPLTNAVGSGGATQANTYYNSVVTNFGEYGFIFLSEIIDNFTATYTGEGKILANVLKGDISFHAHRALQELSYDTLVSSKSQEIEVCPSLKMPLPHDYVNYTKLVSIDANGIEHIIYPARNTSHPFAISQDDNCAYNTEPDGTLQHQQEASGTETVTYGCDPAEMQALIALFEVGQSGTMTQIWNKWDDVTESLSGPISLNDGQLLDFPGTFDLIVDGVTTSNYGGTLNHPDDIFNLIQTSIDDYCSCIHDPSDGATDNCGFQGTWGPIGFDGIDPPVTWWADGNPFHSGWTNIISGISYIIAGGGGSSQLDTTVINSFIGGTTTTTTYSPTSNSWDNYSGGSSTSLGLSDPLNPSSDNSNYFLNEGQRYGIDPQYAHANGSYFIDHMRGNIHFSSALAGKTIVLKYISDGHGTDNEMMVPKMAEEAMYKWIAYGCAQARIDVDQGTIARLKKEKAAETRKAKIRLSNIKLEEITQIMRGKSKWIKH